MGICIRFSALHWVFQLAFSTSSLVNQHASSGFTASKSLTSPEITCWGQSCQLSSGVNSAFSRILVLGKEKQYCSAFGKDTCKPQAALQCSKQQLLSHTFVSIVLPQVRKQILRLFFHLYPSSKSQRLTRVSQTHIFLSLPACSCKECFFQNASRMFEILHTVL